MEKKLLYLFSALLVLTSCSNDETKEDDVVITPKSQNLLKKSIETNGNGIVRTAIYTYEGNKIDKIIYDDGATTVFTYTGDLITKTVQTEIHNGKAYSNTTTFAYEGNKLRSSLKVYSENRINTMQGIFSYDVEGKISATYIDIDPLTQKQKLMTLSALTLDSNKNIVKAEMFTSPYNVSLMEYDTKNTPFKNIVGASLIFNSDVFGREVGLNNNKTKEILRYGKDNEVTLIYSNIYNSDNYLITSDNGRKMLEYFY